MHAPLSSPRFMSGAFSSPLSEHFLGREWVTGKDPRGAAVEGGGRGGTRETSAERE